MRKFFLITLVAMLWTVSFMVPEKIADAARSKLQSGNNPTALFLDYDTRLDINNLEMFVYNDGNFAYDNANVLGKSDGLYYPRGTSKTVIYSSGLWLGAKVNGEIRLAIAEYSSEFVPGPMANGTSLPDEAAFKVYKIRKGDNAASNPDYANWPVDQGAPVDELGNPLVLGDQTTWSVFNDADSNQHTNDAGNTLPLGVEIQHTAFGWARSTALGNVYFLKYILINKDGSVLDSTFVSIWADTDLGNASDDLVGCDTLLSLGYCYNEGEDVVYGAAPPAVGFDFLHGPIVAGLPSDTGWLNGVARPGFRNLEMTSFNKYINGTDPANVTETFGYMKGLVKDPGSQQMVPMTDPSTGLPIRFAVPGDPIAQTGWTDQAAADRRLMLSAGPFTMSPGDTQEVVVAVLVGQGNGPINSITELKLVDDAVQSLFDAGFGSGGYPCGDADGSLRVDIGDAVYMVNYIFAAGPGPIGEPDLNCDGSTNITDIVYLINYLFAFGLSPCSACD